MSRLLKQGSLQGKIANPQKRRPRPRPERFTAKPPPPPSLNDAMPCSILELDQTRCHWPLGKLNAIATEFCGGVPAAGQSYCPHHLRMSHPMGSISKQLFCAVRTGTLIFPRSE